jgi:hypothetical protein
MFWLLSALAIAQSAEQRKQTWIKESQRPQLPAKKAVDGHLMRVGTITSPSELADRFYRPMKCDNDGNLYLRTEVAGLPAIHKLNAKGEMVALFEARSNPNNTNKVDAASYFAFDPEGGDLYELVYPHEPGRYVYVYKADGTFKSAVKLRAGFPIVPKTLAVFPSGQFLISGEEYDADRTAAMWPFTGIFAADGALLKELDVGDEKELHDMAVAGDLRAVRPGSISNRAVDGGWAEMGADGNAYLMRWTDPAIFYAISAGGEVVRRFTVDPAEPGYLPWGVHVYKNRIAVLFEEGQRHDKILKIVDLEGHEIATYDEPRKADGKPGDAISAAFACYTENPTRFVSLGSDDDNKVQFWIAEPR